MKASHISAITFSVVIVLLFPFYSFAGVLNDYNPYNVSIPDNGASVSSDLSLSGAQSGSRITKVKVYYEIRHTYPGDLDVWLTAYYGGSWHDHWLYHYGDLGSTDNIIETRDNIHAWDGASPNQTWYLSVRDRASGDVGYIDFFEMWVTYESTADLALTSLTVSPSTVTTREFTACSFNIVNNGPATLSSEGIMVDYYLSSDLTFGDADDVKIGDTGFTKSISPGGTSQINLSSTGLANMVRFWPANQPGGNYYVFARVTISNPPPSDPSSGNNYDRTNSPITYNPQSADLALTSLTVSPSTVTTRAFTACSFNIVNNGPTALSSEGVMVDYYLSNDLTFGDADDVKIGDTGFTKSISPGGTSQINLSSTGLTNMVRAWPESQPAGNYYVYAQVTITNPPPDDPTSGNNYDRTNSTITYNPQSSDPNLSKSTDNLTVSATTVNISVTVQNNGNGGASSSELGYYLSTNTTINTSDYLIGTDAVPSLSIGATSPESITIDVTTVSPSIPTGTYYVGYFIDHLSQVSESNENDNTHYWSTPQVTIPVLAIDPAAGLPEEFALHPNYPNPFNPATTIRFTLPEATHISLVVYDIWGHEVYRLVEGYLEPGNHQVGWRGTYEDGKECPSGIYIVRMVTPEFVRSIKLVKMK